MSEDLAWRAKRYGLRYMEASQLCVKREKGRRGFRYLDAGGRLIRGRKILDRIRALVIPPAWIEVCIADDPKAHLQAIGRDSEGRLQYRYHDDWTNVRDKLKAERLLRFGQALPRIRARLDLDLKRPKADRRYAAAGASRLIDRALLRSGHSVSEPEIRLPGREGPLLLSLGARSQSLSSRCGRQGDNSERFPHLRRFRRGSGDPL